MKTTRSLPMTLLLAFSLTLAARAQDAIPWVQDLSEARRLAEQQQRLVLLHFWGDGCPPCAQLEANVFNQPEFIRVVSTNFVPVKIKVQDQQNIAKYYGIKRIPTDVIVLPSGKEVFRTESPAKANAYIAMLDQVRANAATGLAEVNRFASTAKGTVSDASQQVDRTAQNAMNAANQWSQQGLAAADKWGQKAQNTADRTAQDASNRANDFARNAMNKYQQMMPTLPPQEGEQPTSEPYNSEPPAEASADYRSNPTAGTDESSRNAIVNNQFVGPTDPSAAPQQGGSRYGNPYVGNDTAAAQQAPANQASTTAPNQALAGNGAPYGGSPAPPAPAQQPSQPMQGYAGMGTAQMSGTSATQPRPQPAVPANQQYAAQPPVGGVQAGSAGPTGAQPPAVQRHQLPPGVPPLALDGYCPVTLVRQQKWEQGSPQFGAIHRGRTYFFKSDIERSQFLAQGAADQFAPVLSGYDPVRFAELHQTVEGSREHGVIYQNQIYLFADEQALAQFEQQPERYVNVVRQAMANARPTQPQR